MSRHAALALGLIAVSIVCLILEFRTEVEGLQIGSLVGAVGAAIFMIAPAIAAWDDLKARKKIPVWFDIGQKLAVDEGNGAHKVITWLINGSSYPVDFEIDLMCTIYGTPVGEGSLPPSYSAQRAVLVPPKGMHGTFSLTDLLSANGMTIDRMAEDACDANRSTQLRVTSKLRYRATGTSNWADDLPRASWYFDFRKRFWVYDTTS